MDNTIKVSSIFYKVFFAFAAILVLFVLGKIPLSDSIAKADSFVEVEEIVCQELNVTKLLNDGIADYTERPYDTISNPYQRGISIKYNLNNVDYVQFGYSIDGQAEILGEIIDTSGMDTITYVIDKSGIIAVKCYAYRDEVSQIITSTVKSDLVGVETSATATSMNNWVGPNVNFDITLDWSAMSDALSGSGRIFYAYDYSSSAKTDIAWTEADTEESLTLTLTVSGNGTFKLFCFDRAGNGRYSQYVYDKFDEVKPIAPTIQVTPNVNLALSNGYAKEYEVSIIYHNDNQSGNADSQFYLVNDRIFTYHGSFTLNTALRYTIIAYTTDKVGNRSDNVTYIINSETFDVDQPMITQKTLTIDLTKEIIAEFSFRATDTLSGIDYAYCQTLNSNLTKGAGDIYRIEFSPYEHKNLYFKVVDKAGNLAIEHFVISNFDDNKLNEKITAYSNFYRNLIRDEYNQTVLEKIDNEYAKLNTLLMAQTAQESNILASFSVIDRLIAGNSEHSYVILSVPVYVSTMLTFAINENDFEGYKKGDKVTVTLNSAVSNGTDYVKMSGFSKGFVDYFRLSVYFNEVEKTNLDNGIQISMNLPSGYLERKFMIIDMSDNKIVETEISNNKINFVCKGSSAYAFVISGNRTTSTATSPKMISVFGKRMEAKVFFGVLGGVFGGAAVIIVLLTVIKKKKRY